MWLDALAPARALVGYGMLGVLGGLGYEDKRVRVGGKEYAHALSAHPPASVTYSLRGRYSSFSCRVALNDDVPAGVTDADFAVVVDRREALRVTRVRPGEPARPVFVRVAGARV